MGLISARFIQAPLMISGAKLSEKKLKNTFLITKYRYLESPYLLVWIYLFGFQELENVEKNVFFSDQKVKLDNSFKD